MHFELPPGPLLVMLDFDGTLIELARRPHEIVVPEEVPLLLEAIQNAGHELTIVTGRRADEVRERLHRFAPKVIGLHGLEWPDEALVQRHALLDETLRKLEPLVNTHRNLILEDKGVILTLHTRTVEPDHKESLEAEIHALLLEQSERSNTHGEPLTLLVGNCVLELRPKAASKALAVERLISEHPGHHPLYIGDDTTDEEAFASLAGIGTSIRVGESGPTRARFRLANVGEVHRFLNHLKGS